MELAIESRWVGARDPGRGRPCVVPASGRRWGGGFTGRGDEVGQVAKMLPGGGNHDPCAAPVLRLRRDDLPLKPIAPPASK